YERPIGRSFRYDFEPAPHISTVTRRYSTFPRRYVHLTSRVFLHGGLPARLAALLVLLSLSAVWVAPAAVPVGAQNKGTPAAGSGGKIANVPDNPYGVNVF